MKILVTGANGYLGSGIVKRLLDDDMEVIATDIKTNNIDNRATIVQCDLFNEKDIAKKLHNPDVVLHLAWRDGFVHNSNIHIDDLPSHFHFIEAMAMSGIKRITIMGSMHEIGFFEGSIDENTPCNPMSLYGISKNALHESAQLICNQYKIPLQWLRGFYIVSDSQYGSSIFSKIVVAEKEGKKSFPFTMGQNQYDFLDYEDFCHQVTATVEQGRVVGTINICSGRPEKLADRVERFIDDNEYSVRLDYGKFPDRPYDSKAIWGNEEKIQSILHKL
ncbi:MAG: NAD-dependent epimerase/dehydratase family protein [Anaerostipes sp.]|nr:NAD-dependent epimerase/dehydratase family protein [Anaerostipes sp.]